jgi:hypothetical protein
MLAQAFDFHRARLTAQGWIDDGELYRPGPNDGNGLNPARCRNPFVAFGFGGMKPEQAFTGYGREDRDLSQKRPSMSQKVPYLAEPATASWRAPSD